eukprot:TRINITY_DN8741_c0_g1_i4.p1 TRINITY_DN8741_c0_g1~~TRINITY_DN8741_c0_g1_i4.p1  ORF type:complete len:286 (+),score=41.29 TRINITY_DN8741_c0_g1_i4:78-935(+)
MENHRYDLEGEWPSFLDNNGYVVIKAVADPQQVATAIDLFWKHFEDSKGISRDNMDSWKGWKTDRRGIVTNAGVIQCAGAWYVRGLPKVKTAFSRIWQTDDLIVSMDSLILWKPWWHDREWTPITEGLHVDQNPFQKPNKCCIQGMLPLYDVTEEIGGLEVVPMSHSPERQDLLRSTCSWMKGIGDFCMIPGRKNLIEGRKLLLAQAGDLILWDSRTIHGGLEGSGRNPQEDTSPRLARLTMTVCMLPRDRATEEVLDGRKQGFLQGQGFTHWPDQLHVTSYAGE